MVELTAGLSRTRVLEALDETPQTTERLARRLDADPDEVQDRLEAAEEDRLVVDWGDVWATTWRAKLRLRPEFFKVWIPGSLALGALLTGLAVVLNAPGVGRFTAAGALAALALAAGALASIPLLKGNG